MDRSQDRSQRRARLSFLASGSLVLLLAACSEGSIPTPTDPNLVPDSPSFAKGPQATICHLQGNGDYSLVTVNSNALPAHEAHGDLPAGAAVPGGGGATLDADCKPQSGASFDGVYTHTFLVDGVTHTDRAVVVGLTVTGTHTWGEGDFSGGWNWTGTITPSPTDPTTGTITGSGTRWDSCCGTMEFTLDAGGITLNADGTAELFYLATHPDWGQFGSAAFRPAP